MKKKKARSKKTAIKKTKKTAKKITTAKKPKNASEKPIGKVTHFFRKIKVAVVKFSKSVNIGAKIKFKGYKTNFEQKISSIQIDHKSVKKAPAKKIIGMKVDKRVRKGDKIYSVK